MKGARRQGKATQCTEALARTSEQPKAMERPRLAQIGPREAQLRAQRERAMEREVKVKPRATTGPCVDLPESFRLPSSTKPPGQVRASRPAQPARKAMAKAKPMPPKGGKGGKKGGKGC